MGRRGSVIVPSVTSAADVFPVVDGGGGINYSRTLDPLPPGRRHGGDRHWLEPFTSELQLAAARGCTTPCLQQGYGSPGPRHVALMVLSHTQGGQQHVIVLPLLSTALLLPMYTFGKKVFGHNIRIKIAYCVLTLFYNMLKMSLVFYRVFAGNLQKRN